MGHFVCKSPSKPLRHGRPTIKEIKPEYSLCRIRCSQERYRLRFTCHQSGTGLNFTCTVYQTVAWERPHFKTDSRQLSTAQTDAALLANNSQHCWMLHVASVCTPCRMLLRKVWNWSNVYLRANGCNNSNNVGSCSNIWQVRSLLPRCILLRCTFVA